MVSAQQQVRVGVGVLVRDPRDHSRIFAGIRKGTHGAGRLALPGGHLELFETWEECAKREVKEETGLDIEDVKFAHVTNDIMIEEDKHYITIFMVAKCTENSNNFIPQNLEPHKCMGWQSFSWNELSDILMLQNSANCEYHLFGPLKKLIEDSPETILDFFHVSHR